MKTELTSAIPLTIHDHFFPTCPVCGSGNHVEDQINWESSHVRCGNCKKYYTFTIIYRPTDLQHAHEFTVATYHSAATPMAVSEVVPSMRKEIVEFYKAMEMTMRHHDATKGNSFHQSLPNELIRALKQEVHEMEDAFHFGTPSAVQREAVDVANFAMMIYTILAPEA